MNLKPLLITLLLIITLNANESVPLVFYEDSVLKEKSFSPNKELKLQIFDEKRATADNKSVQGHYWKATYKLNKPVKREFFITKVREQITKHYHGSVTYHSSDLIHCSIPMGDELYWATIFYQKDRYLVKIVQNKNIKLIRFNNEKKNNRYPWHKMLPQILGYRIDSDYSIYKRFERKKIGNHERRGESWSLKFIKRNGAERISKIRLLMKFKDELDHIGGKNLGGDENKTLFKIDDTYGEFKVVNGGFFLEMIDERKFKVENSPENPDANIKLYGLLFDSGSAKLSSDEGTKDTLSKIESILEASTGLGLEIQGHTDNRGSAIDNDTLSLKRANAVKEALIKRGVSASRLQTKGFGARKPLVSNETEDGRAKNRRVELKMIRGKISLGIENFPPLYGYKVEVTSFDHAIINNKKGFRVEGKEIRGQYNLIGEKSKLLPSEIIKKYKEKIQNMKGEIISQTKDKLYFKLNENISGGLSSFEKYYYISLIYKKGVKQ